MYIIQLDNKSFPKHIQCDERGDIITPNHM